MQRSEKKNVEESSTSKIYLGLGGPPKKPPVFGERVRIYDGSEIIKIDENGMPYMGMSMKELQEKLAEDKKENGNLLPNEKSQEDILLNEKGIYRL